MRIGRPLAPLLIAAAFALAVSLAAVMTTDASDSLSATPQKAELHYPNLGYRLDQLVTRVESGEASATEAADDTSVPQRLGQLPPPGTAPGGSFATDREALVALYNATDGDNWTNNDNWLSDAPLGDWYGVTTAVTPEGNVQLTGLDLAENRLAGELPPELGNLAHLEALSLTDNQLTGEIPAQLGNLYYLSSLHLAGNQLTGCLPANWQDVPSNDFGDAGLPFCEASSPESLPSETEKRPASTANSSSGASTMYWADQGTDKIQRANLDGSRVEDVVTSLPQWVRSSRSSGPNDIALDVAAGKIYWTVWDGNPAARNKIQRANLDGSRVEDLVTALPGVRKPNGLALDLSAGKIYWTNTFDDDEQGTDKIQRANLDGSQIEDLVTSGLGWPIGISLDAAAGKMYWTDTHANKIQRANLDGSQVEDLIVTSGLDVPANMALEVATGKMYWTNYQWTGTSLVPGSGEILRANLDGSQVENLVTSGLDRPDGLALDVAAGKMYWADRDKSKIQRGNLDGSRVEDLIASGLDRPSDIALDVPDTVAPPPPAGACFQALGALTAAVTRNASWTGACASTHRDGRYARFYSFTLNQRTEVEINLTSSQDTFLYLLRGSDANGAVVTDNDDIESGNTNSRITRTLAAGTYTVEATTYNEGVTGSFTLEVGLHSSPGPVSLDAVLFSAGTLNGQRLSTVTPSLSVTPGQAISGTVHIAVQNDHRPGAIFPVGATPTWGDHQGSYWSIDHSAPSFSTTPYEVPVALTAPSTPGIYAIVFAAAPETSLAHVMSATRWYSGPPRWDNGDDIAGWDASRVNFAMANGYVIAPSYPEEAYHFGAAAVRIVVNPTVGPPPPSADSCFQSLGALTAAVTRSGAWTGDCASTHRGGRHARFYSFTLSQQGEVDINLTSTQDTFLYLLRGADANGAEVTNNDDVETGNTNSRITRTLAAGTYTIEATTYGEGVTGDFTLSIVPAGATAPPPSADSCFQSLGALTAAVTRSGAWTGDCASTHRGGRHARFYSFTLSQQGEVDINLTSTQDTFLYLLRGADANGAEVTNNDDVETGNTNSRITRTLAAGTYTIEATTYGEGVTGDFTLSIVPAGATAPPPSADSCFQSLGALTAAVTRSGAWTGDCASTHRGGRHARFYSFTLSQQGEVDINLTSTQDTFLYLLRGADANGAEVTNNDDVETGNTNSRITRTLAAGTYTIEATTYGEGVTGDFTLSIVPAGTTAPPPSADSCFQSLGALTAAVTRSGAWTGDCASTHRGGRHARFYSFTLSQQGEVDINLTSTQDTFLYLLRGADANGAEVTNNDDVETGNTNSRITRTLAAGTYTIEATTYGEGVTGDFTLSIVPAGATAPPPPQPPPADACEDTLTAGDAAAPSGGSISGQWTGDCASTNQAGSYARYYTFTLPTASEVTITLESSVDTFLYLLEGAGTVGAVVAENNDVETGNTNSQITEFLAAGTYTIEATTYKEAVTGEFTLTVTSITVTVVPVSGDRDALVALYHATGGANWRSNRNWLSNTPLDQWYGVTTNSSDRVTELELSFNGLTGQLPAQLGNLSSLRRLDLSDNELNGQLPPELGNLSNLEELDLWLNQLSGPLPPELGNLSSLEDLNLWNNRLSGPIPAQLGNLFSLTYLGLGANRLSGSIPSELGRLGNLTGLSLSDNRLTGEIPPELGDLSNLASLYLSGNQLTGCIPEGLQNVANNDFASLDLPFCGASGSPDLVVQSPSASNNNPDAGEHFTFYAQVHNQGDGVSASTTLRYYRSDNDTISTSDTEVGTNQIVALGASQTWSPSSIGVNAPSRVGTYYYGACVDPVPAESNTRNNCSTAEPVIVGASGSPDLVVQSPSASNNNPDAGEHFTFYAQVHNQGDGVSASTTLRYYRSDNDTISTSDTEVGTNQIVALGASQTWSPSSIGVNAPSRAGTYYYGACVDPVPGESNTRNNCSAGKMVTVIDPDTANQAPTVSRVSPSSPVSLTSGDSQTFSARATDPDNNISQWEWYVNNQSQGGQSLSLTGSITRTFSHTFSSAGNYTVTVTFTDADGESGSVSWSVAVCCAGQGSPDLYVYSPSVYDKVFDPGERFQMSFWVRNQGDGASTTSAALRYYRSTNSTISASDTQLTIESGTTGVGPIEASGSTLVSVYLNAHSSGTYYYGACVATVAGESNTQNNCAAVFRVTLAAPDLVVQSESVSDSSVEAGDTFTFRATVRNQGDGTAVSTTLRYYRSTNSTISTSDTEVGMDSVSSLDPSETSAESERLTAPDSAGTYYYGACVDPVPGESNTRNNCSAGKMVTVIDPDTANQAPTVSRVVLQRGQLHRTTLIGGERFQMSFWVRRLTAPDSAGTYYYGACVDSGGRLQRVEHWEQLLRWEDGDCYRS